MESFQEHQRLYREQHRTLGCKITHMIGIPMIAVALPLFFLEWRIATLLFVTGWILQFIGHYVFEKNKPVFLGNPFDVLTYVAALVFAGQEWLRLLTGKPLVEPMAGSR
jgi:uncharacterized membrane protein YGL010W